MSVSLNYPSLAVCDELLGSQSAQPLPPYTKKRAPLRKRVLKMCWNLRLVATAFSELLCHEDLNVVL